MTHRTLGRTGVHVSPLCLGAMMFGAWGETDHDEAIRIIHRALDAGINFIDTADVYSRGESEEIVGKALAGGRREHVVLATKFHGTMGDDVNQAGNSRRWIVARGRELAAAAEDGLDRPLPGPPLGPVDRPRRDAGRAERPGRAGQGALHRFLHLSRGADRQGSVDRARSRTPALRLRAAALLDAGARHRGRRAPHVQRIRDGRDPVEPARRRLAVGTLAQGRRRT